MPPAATPLTLPERCAPETGTAIIGGGIIGLSVAWELSRRGHRVTVIDRDELPGSVSHLGDAAVGSESDDEFPEAFADTNRCTSWTASGILPPANFLRATDPLDRFRGYSHRLWPTWADELQRLTGMNVGLVRCGGYYLAETVGEAAAMSAMIAYWAELDIECNVLDRSELVARLPQLESWTQTSPWIDKHPERAAWWVPDEYQVRPSRMLKALHAACVDQGVRFIGHANVKGVTESEGRVTVRIDASTSCGDVDAERVVLAGGAATGLIDSKLRLQNALIPIRGQILLLQCDAFDEPFVVNIGNRYLVCRGDGNVLVGSSEEESGFVQKTTEATIAELRRFAGRVSPLLSDAPEIMRWAGLRPMTFDGFPMIGRVPGQQRTFVAAGHYRSGIHFAPATATAVADLIDQQAPFMDLSPFSVGKQQQLQQQLQHALRENEAR